MVACPTDVLDSSDCRLATGHKVIGLESSYGQIWTKSAPGCVNGHNMDVYPELRDPDRSGKQLIGQSVAQCKQLCLDTPGCAAVEYIVSDYGTTYLAGDCQLNDSADASNCDGSLYNSELYSIVRVPPSSPTGGGHLQLECKAHYPMGVQDCGETSINFENGYTSVGFMFHTALFEAGDTNTVKIELTYMLNDAFCIGGKEEWALIEYSSAMPMVRNTTMMSYYICAPWLSDYPSFRKSGSILRAAATRISQAEGEFEPLHGPIQARRGWQTNPGRVACPFMSLQFALQCLEDMVCQTRSASGIPDRIRMGHRLASCMWIRAFHVARTAAMQLSALPLCPARTRKSRTQRKLTKAFLRGQLFLSSLVYY